MRQRKTHKTRRGFAALLLSLCAIVSTLAVALPARAAADDDVYVPELPEGVEGRQADTLQEAAKMLAGKQGTIYLTHNVDVDTVDFDGNRTAVTIRSYVEGAKLTVTKSGKSANMLTLSGGAKVTLENVVFDASKNTEGRTVSVKGGSTLTLGDGAVLQNNTTYGAVYLDNSAIIVDGGEIRDNHAAEGNVDTKKCTVSGAFYGYTYTAANGERQPLGGAVLMVNGSTLDLRSGELSGNTALSGGAVFASDLSSMTLSGGVISRNATLETDKNDYAHGGAISIEKSEKCSVIIQGKVSIQDNTCGWNGAGLYLDWDVGAVDLTMTGGTFSGNHAGRNGATICSLAYSPVIDISGDSVFKDNISDTYGGLYLTKATHTPLPESGRGRLYIHGDVFFTGNTAVYGSCLSVTKNGAINDVTLEGCTFTRNTAKSNSGGACYLNVASGTITMDDVTYTGNSSTRNGGAFYAGLTSSTLTVDGGTYRENFAGFSGGAFYAQIDKNSSVTVQGKALFEKNQANVNAGAFSLKRAALGNAGTVQLLECDVLNNWCNAIFDDYTGTDLEPTRHYNTGGIYVGEDVTCYMYDALITDNSVLSGYEENVVGSGIALCPNAEVYLFQEHGATIYGNGAENTMDILAVPYDEAITHETPAKLYVSDIAPDGRPYNWTDLNGGKARTGQYDWTNVFNGIATAAAFEDGSSGETSTAPVGFKANLEPGIQTMALNDGRTGDYMVNIKGNYSKIATLGAGGVMVNGTVISGGFEVSIMKETKGLSDAEKETKTFQFEFDITPYDNSGDIKVPFTKTKNDIPVGDGGTITFKYRTGIGSDPKKNGMQAIINDLKSDETIKLKFDEGEGPKFDFEDNTDYTFYLTEIDDGGAAKSSIEWKALDASEGDLGEDLSSGGGLDAGELKTIQFTVTNIFTELDLTKVVEGGGDEEKLWIFNLTLQETEGGMPLSGTYPVELWDSEGKIDYTGDEYNGIHFEHGDGEITLESSGETTVYLKHGQTLKIKGLPPGSYYSVTEASLEGYTTTFEGASGTISENPDPEAIPVAKFTNTYTLGDLVVSKTVEGDGGDTEKAFSFRVELSDKKVTGTYGEMTFEKGVAEFTLKHGGSKTASGLPKDITYTVTEKEADGYTSAATGATGTIQSGATALASFVNRRVMPDIPQTGDEGRPLLWAALACAGALGALLLVRRLRREP